MTTRPVTQSAGLYPYGRLRARLGLQVKRMLGGLRLRGANKRRENGNQLTRRP